MSTAETVAVIIVIALVLLVIGSVAFSILAERKNPPIGTFIECDGVRLHYLESGDSRGPLRRLVPWQRLNESRISRSAGLLTVLPAETVSCALTGQASGIVSGRARAFGPQQCK